MYVSGTKPTLMFVRDEYTEKEFQTEMHKLRRHMKNLFADTLPEPRIIEDVTGNG